jgi:hypothetical protein
MARWVRLETRPGEGDAKARWTMIPSVIYLDRFRNEGTRVYSPHAEYTEADERYRPNSRVSTFDIPAFEVPSDEVNVYTADPAPALRRIYVSEERDRFGKPLYRDTGKAPEWRP